MAVKLMDLFFTLADGAFPVETNIEGSSVFELFCYHILVSLRDHFIRDGRAH